GILFQARLIPRRPLIRGMVRYAAWAATAAGILLTLWPTPYFFELGSFDSLASFGATFIILETTSSQTWLVKRVLSQHWLVYIGKISYGLYLWHYPLFRLLQSTSWSPTTVQVAQWSATIAITLTSYYLVERPFLRFKTRLATP